MAEPPSLLDTTTLYSLLSTLAILLAALLLSRRVLDPHSTPTRLRLLFIWHAFDALIHFILEGSFVYHCLFAKSSIPVGGRVFIGQVGGGGVNGKWVGEEGTYWSDPRGFLNGDVSGSGKVMHGAQAGGENPLAALWMVYAKADARWAGVDLVRYVHTMLRFVLCA